MKGNEKLRPSGPFSKSIISVPDTFLISFSSERPFPEVILTLKSSWSHSFTIKIFFFVIWRALWLLLEREHCWPKLDCQVEETGLWKPLLSTMHPNARYQLWNKLHMSRSKSQDGRSNHILAYTSSNLLLILLLFTGKNCRMRSLRLSWMFWLKSRPSELLATFFFKFYIVLTHVYSFEFWMAHRNKKIFYINISGFF